MNDNEAEFKRLKNGYLFIACYMNIANPHRPTPHWGFGSIPNRCWENYMYKYVTVYVYINTYIDTYVYIYKYKYTYKFICLPLMEALARFLTDDERCIYIYIYMYIYTYKYIYIYIYICIYTYVYRILGYIWIS
jgi:hypothetical protein